jgi:hypothetical protein
MMAKTSQSLEKVSVNSPQSLAKFATPLKKFIVERKLYTKIQDKNYVNVEGWEFAGACMGIQPIVREVTDKSSDKEIKYHARVELVLIANGKVVGSGEAVCSNKEKKKSSFDEYAIASMAQTRAIGKAYRNSFAWLMKMAGYEPTPAEEAVYDNINTAPAAPETVLDPIEEVKTRVTAKLDSLSSVERMKAIKVTGHTSLSKLTDLNWRTLDENLSTNIKQGELPMATN